MTLTWRETLDLVREDMQARCRYEGKEMTRGRAVKFLFNPAVLCVVVYRLQTYAHLRRWSWPERLLRLFNRAVLMVSFDAGSRIGGGLVILHAHGVYISGDVVAGKNLMLFHQNSIGYSPFYEEERALAPRRGPVIGDDVVVGAGATICGPITIGDGCKIAVNSAVDCDCAPGSVMFGVPARQVSKR